MKLKPVLLSIVIFASCTSSHDQLKKQIDSALTAANKSLVEAKADTMNIGVATRSINEFVAKFPKDTLSPSYLFELALLNEKQQKYPEAITTLDKIYSGYPDSKQASKAIFLEGFLYANVLNQLEKAKEKYQLYLYKYSAVDPKMTNDVKMELQNLGKSPEEILKEIQEKAKADSSAKV